MNLHNDLSEFVGLLNSHEVEYLIVGGHSVAFHGYPRFTGDIDIFIRSSPVNADRLLAVLTEFGFGDLDITRDDLLRPERIVQLGYPPNRIALLTSISGVTFESAWESKATGRLAGHEVCYLGLKALITNKEASNRTQDRLDVEKLRQIMLKQRQ